MNHDGTHTLNDVLGFRVVSAPQAKAEELKL